MRTATQTPQHVWWAFACFAMASSAGICKTCRPLHRLRNRCACNALTEALQEDDLAHVESVASTRCRADTLRYTPLKERDELPYASRTATVGQQPSEAMLGAAWWATLTLHRRPVHPKPPVYMAPKVHPGRTQRRPSKVPERRGRVTPNVPLATAIPRSPSMY